jgi:hypothetical protein
MSESASNTSAIKSFHYLENGEVSFSIFDTIRTNKALDPGFYQVTYVDHPENRVRVDVDRDIQKIKIHTFPDRLKLDDLFGSFFNNNVVSKISELGFYHKVGVLMHGQEGTGKSTVLRYYCDKAIKDHQAIVFYINRNDYYIRRCWDFIIAVRNIQSNPIIVIIEEIDSYLRDGNEAFLKTVLDGNMSINNCIFFGTTNYINSVPDALKNRPSRFKYSLHIEAMTLLEDIFSVVDGMLGGLFTQDEITTFSTEMKGKTLDYIKQFCIDKIMDIKSYDNNRRNKVGFFADR